MAGSIINNGASAPTLGIIMSKTVEIYTVDEYADTFFGGVKARMAEHCGIARQQVSDWRRSGMFFIVDNGEHSRCTTCQVIDICQPDSGA